MKLPLCLAACGTGAPFKANTAVACAVDGVLQPIGAATLTALVPETAHGVSIDTLIVHPAIVKLCTDMNGVPVQAATP